MVRAEGRRLVVGYPVLFDSVERLPAKDWVLGPTRDYCFGFR